MLRQKNMVEHYLSINQNRLAPVNINRIGWYCIILEDIQLYCMVLAGIGCYLLVLNGFGWYGMVLHRIGWYCMGWNPLSKNTGPSRDPP